MGMGIRYSFLTYHGQKKILDLGFLEMIPAIVSLNHYIISKIEYSIGHFPKCV